MNKKLPGVFANEINKQINNNEKVYASTKKEIIKEAETPKSKVKPVYEKTIKQKIDDIFKSKKYIYKIPVKITTDDEELTKYIIGRNTKNLITIDNELVEIEKVKDIALIDQEKNE